MPSIAKPHAAKTIAIRSTRKPRRREPGDAANRRTRRAAPATGDPANAITIKLLQELVDILRNRAAVYERRRSAAEDAQGTIGTEELRGLADEDLTHSRWLAERITELGGASDAGARRDRPDARRPSLLDVKAIFKADLTFESAALDRYGCLLTIVGESDLTTKFLIEDILFDELEHAGVRHACLAD
jgi:bacterioferritin (cytochrome b1)